MLEPTVIALRRPTRPWGTGDWGDIVVDPDPPPPLPDYAIPFEITLTPPNGLGPDRLHPAEAQPYRPLAGGHGLAP